MDTRQAIENLDRYIRANYPIIVITTHEENRVTNAIKEKFGRARDDLHKWVARDIYEWKVTTSLENATDLHLDSEEVSDPGGLLLALCEVEASAKPNIFIIKDFHPYLENPFIIRAMRDLAERFSKSPHTAIFISPEFDIPLELEKSVAIMDWPLPSYDELKAIVERVEKRLPSAVPINLNGNREKVIQALQGLTAFEATSALLNAVAATREFGEDIIPIILSEKKQIIRKTGILEFYETDLTMDDVGGLEKLKAYADIKRKSFNTDAKAFGVDPAKGVLLAGVPGTGKSLSAKAMSNGELPLLRVDIGALFGGLVGESERNTRTLFRLAKAVSPCMLWLDEIEKGLGSGRGELDGGTSDRVLGTILTGMQETEEPVYFIATANDVDKLPPALVRRFDDVFWVDLPNTESRKEIFEIHLRKRDRDPNDFNVDKLAELTREYTGAEIEKVVRASLENAFADGSNDITDRHLATAVTEIIPIKQTMEDKIDKLRKWAIETNAKQASGELELVETTKDNGERELEI